MKPMFEEQVLPRLRERAGATRVLRTPRPADRVDGRERRRPDRWRPSTRRFDEPAAPRSSGAAGQVELHLDRATATAPRRPRRASRSWPRGCARLCPAASSARTAASCRRWWSACCASAGSPSPSPSPAPAGCSRRAAHRRARGERVPRARLRDLLRTARRSRSWASIPRSSSGTARCRRRSRAAHGGGRAAGRAGRRRRGHHRDRRARTGAPPRSRWASCSSPWTARRARACAARIFPGDRERVRYQATQVALEMLRRGLLGLAAAVSAAGRRAGVRRARARRAACARPIGEPAGRASGPRLGGIRLVRPEGIHLTLRFLGDTSPAQVETLRPAARRGRRALPAGRGARRAASASFPERGQPRASCGWASSARAGPRLQARLRGGGAWRPASRARRAPFRPHLTLGRWRDRARGPTCRRSTSGATRLDALVLFRSDCSPGGAVYTPLARFAAGRRPRRVDSRRSPMLAASSAGRARRRLPARLDPVQLPRRAALRGRRRAHRSGSGNVGATNVHAQRGQGRGARSPSSSTSARARRRRRSPRRLAPGEAALPAAGRGRRRSSGTCIPSGSGSAGARASPPAPGPSCPSRPSAARGRRSWPSRSSPRPRATSRWARWPARVALAAVAFALRGARSPSRWPPPSLPRSSSGSTARNLRRILGGDRAPRWGSRRSDAMRIAVLGGGSWGTALAAHLARAGHAGAALGPRARGRGRAINETRENPRYLPGVGCRRARATDATSRARSPTPRPSSSSCPRSSAAASTAQARRARPGGRRLRVRHEGPRDRHAAAHDARSPRRRRPGRPLAVLSGPSFALEVAQGQPTAVVVASADHAVAESGAARARHPDLPRLLERRRGRRRAGRRPQERHRHRRRDRRRPRLRPQHRGRPHHPRPRRDHAPRGGARAAAPTPSPASPASATSCSPAPGALSRNRRVGQALGRGRDASRRRGRAAHGRRGRPHHPGRLRPGRAGGHRDADRPADARPCSTRASRRARRVDELMLRSLKRE